MANGLTNLSEREERFGEIAFAYLQAREGEPRPNPREWLARYPEFGAELADFIADQEEVERLGAPLREIVGAGQRPSTQDPDATTEQAPSLSAVGLRSFGDYEVLEVMARGGMGVVYRARQRSLNRLVALKVIRAGEWATAEEVRRFRNEAEMVALLDHPNIVPVHEVSEQAGQLYFSMKLLEGGSLAEHLDRYRDDSKAAANLLATVARAVHHAHQRGVLHRDLKPSNILLDEDGRPHVTDFGLARRVAVDSSLTQSGAIVGTPSYVAPEQTTAQKGTVTTATDVYGLGAVFYALLTGRPPFVGETVLETLEKVRERDPEPPRRSNPKVDRDLETICLKCLQKEPQRRYESAQAVAEDLERWLACKPIRARRVGRWERFGKWVRRRPALASLVMVSVLAVLGLVGGLFWHDDQLRDAAKREHNQALAANREKEEAQRQRAFARRAADRMYTQVVEKWLVNEPGSEKLQREFLEEALRFYQELAGETDEDLSVQHELANTHRRMGEIFRKLGQPDKAEEALTKALSIAERLTEARPEEEECQSALANIHNQIGALKVATSRPREAEEALRRCLGIRSRLADQSPSVIAYRKDLGSTLLNLGSVLMNMDRRREAEATFRKAQAILEKLAAEFPDMPGYRVTLGGILNNLGILVMLRGELPEARRLLEEAIRHETAALRIDPRNKVALEFLDNHHSTLVEVLARSGDQEGAIKEVRESLKVAERLVVEFPSTYYYRGSLAHSQYNLGVRCQVAGRLPEAEEAFRSAVTTFERIAAEMPKAPVNKKLRGAAHEALAKVILDRDRGRRREAATEFQKALQSNPDMPAALNNLAHLLAEDPDPAFRDLPGALKLANRAVKQEPNRWELWRTLGVVQYRAGDWSAAIASLRKAQEIEGQRVEMIWLFLAMAHWRQGDRESARKCHDRARALAKGNKASGTDLPRYREEAARLLMRREQSGPDGKEAPQPKN